MSDQTPGPGAERGRVKLRSGETQGRNTVTLRPAHRIEFETFQEDLELQLMDIIAKAVSRSGLNSKARVRALRYSLARFEQIDEELAGDE